MKSILGLLKPREESIRRIRRQLHKGKPFTPAPKWGKLWRAGLLTAVGGKQNDRAILAFLRHPHLPANVVRCAVMDRLNEALDTYDQMSSVERIEFATLREILSDGRLKPEEKADVVRLAWSSKIGTLPGQSGFAESWASVQARNTQILEIARKSGSREARVAAEFMNSLSSRGLNQHFLWDTMMVLLLPCEDAALEILWTLIEDVHAAGGTVSTDRMRELIDQAHLVLR